MKACCITDSAQTALFTSIRWPKATTPKRELVLKLVEGAVNWVDLEEVARPYYQADNRRTGRKATPCE